MKLRVARGHDPGGRGSRSQSHGRRHVGRPRAQRFRALLGGGFGFVSEARWIAIVAQSGRGVSPGF